MRKNILLSLLFISFSLDRVSGFVTNYVSQSVRRASHLFPHKFNGGYDASRGISWSPLEAAEFILWHVGETKQAGLQLRPLVGHWSGTDVGEFLTRLYLAEKNETEFKLSFESRNVRNPRWKGLDSEDGIQSLADLLSTCLSDEVLAPAEIARLAVTFLLKEHTWPSEEKPITVSKSTKTKPKTASESEETKINEDNDPKASSIVKTSTLSLSLEKDTFASMGYTAKLATILGTLRTERLGNFTADDVLEMVLLPEHDVDENGLLHLKDFFSKVGIRLTPSEKVDVVQGMARGGLWPSNIAKFISQIQEIPESARPKLSVEVETTSVMIVKSKFPNAPLLKDGTIEDDDDEEEERNDNAFRNELKDLGDDFKSFLPSPFYFGVTSAYHAENANTQANPKEEKQTQAPPSQR